MLVIKVGAEEIDELSYKKGGGRDGVVRSAF